MLGLHRTIRAQTQWLSPEKPYLVQYESDRRTDGNYDLCYPSSGKEVHAISCATRISIEIKQLPPDALPTLQHILTPLADLPTFDIVDAGVVRSEGLMDWYWSLTRVHFSGAARKGEVF